MQPVVLAICEREKLAVALYHQIIHFLTEDGPGHSVSVLL